MSVKTENKTRYVYTVFHLQESQSPLNTPKTLHPMQSLCCSKVQWSCCSAVCRNATCQWRV